MGVQTELNISIPGDTESISGLEYIPDYINQAQENSLISKIDSQHWQNDLKRRVQHYGYRYDYKARNITKDLKLCPLPEWVSSYCDELKRSGLFPKTPDQVIINEYQPGQGISAHIDCVPCFEETIASLSLGSACIMDFSHKKTGQKVSLLLEPRSLVLISGEARYNWQHGIAQRKSDKYNGVILPRGRRVSLTFRNVIVIE